MDKKLEELVEYTNKRDATAEYLIALGSTMLTGVPVHLVYWGNKYMAGPEDSEERKAAEMGYKAATSFISQIINMIDMGKGEAIPGMVAGMVDGLNSLGAAYSEIRPRHENAIIEADTVEQYMDNIRRLKSMEAHINNQEMEW